jgi:hypothetical protein
MFQLPAGKEWQWKANEPEMIVDGWMAQHKQMVRENYL